MSKRNHHSKKEKNKSSVNQSSFSKPLQINPVVTGYNEEEINKFLSYFEYIRDLQAQPTKERDQEIENLLKLLGDLATGIWRTRQKMLQPGTDKPSEELRRAYRPLEATYDILIQSGVEIIDRTNKPFIEGTQGKILAVEPTDGIERDVVLETIKPTIIYHNRLLQTGELIIGTPKK